MALGIIGLRELLNVIQDWVDEKPPIEKNPPELVEDASRQPQCGYSNAPPQNPNLSQIVGESWYNAYRRLQGRFLPRQ